MRVSRLELLDLADPDAMTAPDLAYLGALVRQPSVTTRLYFESPGVRVTFDGWIDDVHVALHQAVDPTEASEVYAGRRSQTPSLFAQIVGLGRRARPDGLRAVVSLADLRNAVTANEPIEGIGAVQSVWTLEWTRRDQGAGGITVMDQGPNGGGLWLARSVGEAEVLFSQVSAVRVWEEFGRVLHAARQLERQSATSPRPADRPEPSEDHRGVEPGPVAAPVDGAPDEANDSTPDEVPMGPVAVGPDGQ